MYNESPTQLRLNPKDCTNGNNRRLYLSQAIYLQGLANTATRTRYVRLLMLRPTSSAKQFRNLFRSSWGASSRPSTMIKARLLRDWDDASSAKKSKKSCCQTCRAEEKVSSRYSVIVATACFPKRSFAFVICNAAAFHIWAQSCRAGLFSLK